MPNRLDFIMDKIILANQSSFIKGRKLVDCVVDEIIDLAQKSRKSCLILKVCFKKTCDLIGCPFLNYMMRQLVFNDSWRS